MSANEPPESHSPPPPHDYYIEDGLIVFTREYHLKRGHCCKSNCRHCPYGSAPSPSTREPNEKPGI